MGRRTNVAVCVLGTVGLLCLLTGCVLIHYMPIIIKNQIKDNVKITEGSAAYDNWKSAKSPPYFQIWAFNLSNYEEVLKGDLPSVEQQGPYTYREEREKFDIHFHHDGTVSYKERTTYFFVPDMSVGSENDTFYTVNIPMITILNLVKDQNEVIKYAVKVALKHYDEKLFYPVSVRDILWGYPEPFLEGAHEILEMLGYNISGIFGLFSTSNGTDGGMYRIHTGEGDLDKLGEITSWKGQPHLSFWTSNSSNRINGSDGTMYAPFINISETKYIFSSDVCRSLGLEYTEDVTHRGIAMDRFVAPEFLFANVSINPSNEGFCTPPGDCLPSGLLNVSACRNDAPIVMSMPHFLGCDPDVIASVHGLKPNQLEHQSFLDVEPLTGVVLGAAKRLQINVYLEPVIDFVETAKLQHMFLPVVWLNESGVISQKDADAFKDGLYGRMRMAKGIKFGLIAFGGLVMLAVVVFMAQRSLCKQVKYKRFTDVAGDDEMRNAAGDSIIT